MRIRISHPHLLEDLVRFLERMGFTVDEAGYDSVHVDLAHAGDTTAMRAQVQLYLNVWQATRRDVSAAVESVDRAEGDR